jgi:hypothetical protein
MKKHSKVLLASAASVAAGLLIGSSLSNKTPDTIESEQCTSREAPLDPASVAEDGAADPALRMRRLVARCETQALWEWLLTAPPEEVRWKHRVITELADRLGWRAMDIAMEIDPDRVRGELSEHLLSKLGERDPWKAYDFWKAHRDQFASPQWGSGALDWAIVAGAATSADKLIEVLQQMTGEESQTLINVEFAAGFDFRAVLDHLAATDRQPETVPADLLPGWAKQSPVEAAAWLLEHPGFLKVEYREDEARSLLHEISGSDGPADPRHRALDVLADMPGDYLDEAWSAVAGRSEGKVNAYHLDSATYMNRRERFLSDLLLETKYSDEMDASWDQVPPEERRVALESADQRWAEEERSPVQKRARERWRTMVSSQWGITP